MYFDEDNLLLVMDESRIYFSLDCPTFSKLGILGTPRSFEQSSCTALDFSKTFMCPISFSSFLLQFLIRIKDADSYNIPECVSIYPRNKELESGSCGSLFPSLCNP